MDLFKKKIINDEINYETYKKYNNISIHAEYRPLLLLFMFIFL